MGICCHVHLQPAGGTERRARAIAIGSTFILALKHDGTVTGWGGPDGTGSVPDGLTDVTAIAAGYAHALALRADGSLVAWGENYLRGVSLKR